ncbi:MAG: hypothetical protein JSU59_08030 [Nitrospirota bacterium]|nr:MAG: hypothetical protein JSU59_08030 [Nitrospirota bacterium]
MNEQPQKWKTGWICSYFLLALFFLVSDVLAQTPNNTSTEDDEPEQTLQQKSLDPTANLKQLQISNRFIPSTFDQEGYANFLVPQIIYPVPKRPLIPVRQVFGLSFPIVTAPGGPTEFSDMRFFDIFIFGEPHKKTGNWFRWGIGPTFVFPTATADGFGSNKWQIGPIAAAIYSAKWWQIALLVENPISFAGDSNAPDVNRLFWVPIWIYWLPKQWYLGIQGTPKSVNWENDAALTFPLSLRLGKLTKFGRRAVNVFVEPEYTAIHDDNIPVPEWSVRLGINFLFPEGF